MKEAYVLVSTRMGTEQIVMDKVKAILGVTEAYMTLGTNDLIIRIQADSPEELKDIVKEKIRKLDNIRTTLTMVVI